MAAIKQPYQRKKLPQWKVIARGNSFVARVTFEARQYRETFPTEPEADAYAAVQQARMYQGLPIEKPAHARPKAARDGQPVTMEELYKYTCEHRWDVGGPNGGPIASADKIKCAAKQCVRVLGPDTDFRTLNRSGIMRALRDFAVVRKNAAATTNRRISALTVMFGEAEKEYQGWKPPILDKTEENNQRTFKVPDRLMADLLQWFVIHDLVDMYDYIVLYRFLGQRGKELRRLRFTESTAHPWDGYFDLENNIALFMGQPAKNKSPNPRYVPLRPVVREVVERRRAMFDDPRARLFSDDFLPRIINREWDKMRDAHVRAEHPDIVSQRKPLQEVGEEFVPHIMRHQFCVELGDLGFTLGEIKAYSGHETDQQAQRYVKPSAVQATMRARRDATFNPMILPGGAVPDFAPSKMGHNVLALPKRDAKAKPDQPAAAVDAAAHPDLVAMMQAAMAGMTPEQLAAMAALFTQASSGKTGAK